MAKLIYSAIASLDGYVADAAGKFDWAAPRDEVHAFVNDLERSVGTYLYGRRMYETMAVWDKWPVADQPQVTQDYAEIWRAASKVVFSRTLSGVRTARTRLARDFDPAIVRRMKGEAERDLTVGGPGLASQALRAGLVEEIHLFLHPVSVGGGTPALPTDARVGLELLDHRTFSGGVIHLHYRVAR